MGFFNFIETFFFISLGITFVLILLLVYHFKQRIITIEQKSETMFEIINNIVKELTMVRNVQMHSQSMQFNGTVNLPIKEFRPMTNENIKVVVSDDESSDSSSDSGSESGSGSDTSSDSDSDSDDDNETSNNIKIINMEVCDNIDIAEISLDKQEVELELSLEEEQVLDNEIEQELDNEIEKKIDNNANDINNDENTLDLDADTDSIIVEKLDSTNELEPVDESLMTVSQSAKEVYRKMTVQDLRALVITKGLSSDPSKMKKPEILKLLESE